MGKKSKDLINNTSAIAYTNNKGGALSIKFHELSQQIWELSWSLKIDLVASHVPGVQNMVANSLSLLATRNPHVECFLHPTPPHLAYFKKCLGPFRLDLFSSNSNKLVINFISLIECSIVMLHNSLAQKWLRT